jgi:hypothetical protein
MYTRTRIATLKTQAFNKKDWTKKHDIHILAVDPSDTLGGIVIQIDGTPGSYYLSTFMSTADCIYVDAGAGWMVENLDAVKRELLVWLGLERVTPDGVHAHTYSFRK